MSYACPDGYVACNALFLNRPGGEDYVLCRDQKTTTETDCPITSIKFEISAEETGLYEVRRDETG